MLYLRNLFCAFALLALIASSAFAEEATETVTETEAAPEITETTTVKKTVLPASKQGTTTIIINNNLTAPAAAPSATPAPVVAQPAETLQAKAPVKSSDEPVFPPLPEPRWNPIRFGVGLAASYNHSGLDGDLHDWTLSAMPGFGVDFELGLFPSKYIGFNTFAGVGPLPMGKLGHFGAEIELVPVHLSAGRFSFLELGFLAGVSNAVVRHHSPWGFHGGARLTLNMTEQFGLTFVGRVNATTALAEAGIVTRF